MYRGGREVCELLVKIWSGLLRERNCKDNKRGEEWKYGHKVR